MSLRKQTFSGLIWTFLDTFLITGISFIAINFIPKTTTYPNVFTSSDCIIGEGKIIGKATIILKNFI